MDILKQDDVRNEEFENHVKKFNDKNDQSFIKHYKSLKRS